MSFISDDPSFWPVIAFDHSYACYVVASAAAVVYDWLLIFGQEFDLIWCQRWSFMTFLYLAVRYSGLLSCGIYVLVSCTSVSVHLTDLVSNILSEVSNWISIIINSIIGVITIIRLYAMYQQSRMVLILLSLVYSAITISCVVIGITQSIVTQYEEAILSGNYMCASIVSSLYWLGITWILGAVWEIPALFLAVWVSIKHFRELPTGWTMEDCFGVLIRSHVHYFASFAAVACLNLGEISPATAEYYGMGEVYNGALRIFSMVQMFVLAPRLILSIRQYNAKVVDQSDEATAMTSIAFQQRTQMSNGHDV